MDLDQIKNILNAMLETVTEKGKEYAGAAVDKTKTASRIARLTVEVAGEKEALKKAYTELGKAYYEEMRGTAEGLFAQLCEEVDAVTARIEGMQTEIADLKAALRSTPAEDADFEDVVSQGEDQSCDEAPKDEHPEE